MAKEDNVTTIWASIGATKNLGNYESLRIDAGARIVVEDIEDEEKWAEVWATIEAQVEQKLNEAEEDLG